QLAAHDRVAQGLVHELLLGAVTESSGRRQAQGSPWKGPAASGATGVREPPAIFSLELQLQRKLELPLRRAAQGAGRVGEQLADLSEGGVAQQVARAADTRVRKLRVVEQVEGVQAQLAVHRAQLRLLDERHVDVELLGPAQAVASRVAEGTRVVL